MDEHQRYELCRKVARDAPNAGVRGRDLLYHVQPVRQPRGTSQRSALLTTVLAQ